MLCTKTSYLDTVTNTLQYQTFPFSTPVHCSIPFWRCNHPWKTVFVRACEFITSHVSKRQFQIFKTVSYLASREKWVYVLKASRRTPKYKLRNTKKTTIISRRFPIMLWRGGVYLSLVKVNCFWTRGIFCKPITSVGWFSKTWYALVEHRRAVPLSSFETQISMQIMSFWT